MCKPDYLRKLLAALELTQTQAAELVGKDARTMRRYLSTSGLYPVPKSVRMVLEAAVLARCTKPVEQHEDVGRFFIRYKDALHLAEFNGRFWRSNKFNGATIFMTECISGVFK